MPWRFYRYLLADVLRQFSITAVILVIVIAFGAAIKPLSSDSLLTGWDTLKYLAFAVVPMLQFALPFAAAFAATIGLHRMAQDNEINAMAVSGQSYVRLLAPMALFGVILTLIVALLTQSIIPRFVGKMTATMSNDLPKLLANSIRQHAPFAQGNMIIWAEDIFIIEDGDKEIMALEHMAAAKIDNTGRASMYLTAASSVVDIQRLNGQTSMLVKFKDSAQWSSNEDGSGLLRGAKEGQLTQAIDLPSISKQRPSSLTRSDLLALRTTPRKYSRVNTAASALEAALTESSFIAGVRDLFDKTNSITCDTVTGERQIIIEAKSMEKNVFLPPIHVTSINSAGEVRNLFPQSAQLLFDQSESGDFDFVSLQMKDVSIGSPGAGQNKRVELVVPLRIRGVTSDPIVAETIPELFLVAKENPSKKIQRSVNVLKKQLTYMEGQIIGRVGQRWAVSLLPLLAIILGSLFAIRFPSTPPLSVYAKVFVPTVIALLLVFAGGQMVRDARVVSGFSVMWSGNIGLTLLVLFSWMKLRKT